MLEVMAVYYLCKKNAENARLRGKKGGGAVAYTIAFWLGFEIIGVVAGYFILGFLNFDGSILVYVIALISAAIGGLFANLISKAGTVIEQPQPVIYNQAYAQYPVQNPAPMYVQNPVQLLNPHQCQNCGYINPSDSSFCMKCGATLMAAQQPNSGTTDAQ